MTIDRSELQREVAERAVHIGSGNKAYAELITELLQPNHIALDIFSAFMPIKERKEGDYFARKIRKGRFRARTMIPFC